MKNSLEENVYPNNYLDFELRSFGFSEYLLLERFSRDFDLFRECLLLWRRLLGDLLRDLDLPIFPSLTVLPEGSMTKRDTTSRNLIFYTDTK